MKRIVIRLVLAVVVLACAWRGYTFLRDLPKTTRQVATVTVRRGDVVVRSFARGELRAARSATLIAPNLMGTVQVTRLAPLGSFARAKDLVVEFDDSEVNSRVEEQELGLEQTDEQIKKAQADLAVSSNQDQVDLLTAQFDVKRAELDIQRNELLSQIDAKKNELALEQAQQHLKQLESDIQSRRLQAKAQIAVLQENRNKSVLELDREKQRLSQVRMLSPISGLIAIRQNRPSFYFPGMQIPDIREGDQINPGMPIADVLDLSELEVLARVGELDRANLREGEDAMLQLDAIPGQRLNGKIKSMSATATANVFSSDPAKKFDVVFSIDMEQLFRVLGVKPDQIRKLMAISEMNKHIHAPEPAVPAAANGVPAANTVPTTQQYTAEELAKAQLPPPPEEDSQFDVLLRPGLLADVEIIVDRVPNAVYLPNQAVFEKDGKLVAYVKNGDVFEPRPFKPLKRSESTMIVASGLEPGDIVALADPTVKKDEKKKGATSGDGAMGALPGK